MRGVIACSALVVIACSSSYADGGASPDGGPTIDGAPSEADIEVTPTELDFGKRNCGDTSAAQIVVLRNRGATKTTYQLQVPDGAAFAVLGPLSGELAPNSVTAVNVVAKPALAGDTTANIVVIAGAKLAQVALKVKGDGGTLEIAPSALDLGGVRRQNGGTVDVSFVNTGSQPISITSIDSSLADFSASWPGKPSALVLPPNAPATVTVSLAAGNESDVLAATLTAHTDGPFCGKVPTLPVKGQRVTSEVTISTADFGSVVCKSSPTLTRDVVVSNYTSSTLVYNATLDKGAGSAFTIAAGASDTLAPGTSTTPTTRSVKLAMKTVGATTGPIGETLTVDITGTPAPAGGKRSVNIAASVHGVLLDASPADLGTFQRGQYKGFTLKNTGSDDATISWSFTRDPSTAQNPAWYQNTPASLAAGASKPVTVQFAPASGDVGTYGGTLSFAAQPTLCNAPVTVHVAGTY